MVIPFVKYLWKKRNTKSTGYTASIAITKWRISDGIMHTSTNRFGSTKCLRYSTSRSFFYSKYCKAYKSGFFIQNWVFPVIPSLSKETECYRCQARFIPRNHFSNIYIFRSTICLYCINQFSRKRGISCSYNNNIARIIHPGRISVLTVSTAFSTLHMQYDVISKIWVSGVNWDDIKAVSYNTSCGF